MSIGQWIFICFFPALGIITTLGFIYHKEYQWAIISASTVVLFIALFVGTIALRNHIEMKESLTPTPPPAEGEIAFIVDF